MNDAPPNPPCLDPTATLTVCPDQQQQKQRNQSSFSFTHFESTLFYHFIIISMFYIFWGRAPFQIAELLVSLWICEAMLLHLIATLQNISLILIHWVAWQTFQPELSSASYWHEAGHMISWWRDTWLVIWQWNVWFRSSLWNTAFMRV